MKRIYRELAQAKHAQQEAWTGPTGISWADGAVALEAEISNWPVSVEPSPYDEVEADHAAE